MPITKEDQAIIDASVTQLRYLGEHNPIMLARAAGAIQHQYGVLSRHIAANTLRPQILGAAGDGVTMDKILLSRAGQQADSAAAKVAMVEAEVAAILAKIPPMEMARLRCMDGISPEADAIIAQRWAALKGLPIPGLNMFSSK